jgi:LDH2 family malate/lactate/ureidoglycolate dehydrogenase
MKKVLRPIGFVMFQIPSRFLYSIVTSISQIYMLTMTATELSNVSEKLLRAAGATDEEARIVTKLLVKANLAGVDSHGVFQNLILYLDGLETGVIKSGAEFEIAKETRCTALVNGNWGFGQVICMKAMNLAIEKARQNGVSAVGIFNCNHIGRLADYTQMAIENDMIGIVTANGDWLCVAPYGGKKMVFSTNPISCGIPAAEERPIVVDFATSVTAEGKIRAALLRGEKLPPGWIADSEGRPSTDPADLYEPPLPPEQVKLAGTILPAGGYKGYGLALVVEALAGALTGTGCDGEIKIGLTNGVFIIVLKIDQFASLEEFYRRVDRLIRTIKASPKAPGFSEILIPGEPEIRSEEERSEAGIPVPEAAWRSLAAYCAKYGLDAQEVARE